MGNVKHFLFGTFLIGMLTGNILSSAEDKSLWSYAMPAADAIIYINTKQAEKAMTPTLWKRIQRDKNKALEENAGDQLFDTKGRDAEAVINLFISSVIPFKANLEGVAMISGNVKGDIIKLLQSGKDSGFPAPQIMKQNDLDFYQYSLTGNEKIPPANFTFSLDRDGLLHFRSAIAPGKKLPVSLNSGNISGKRTLVSGMEQKDLSFATAIRTEKLSIIPMGRLETGKLKGFLGKLNTVLIMGRVYGKFLQISIIFTAKNSQLAEELHQTIQPVLRQFAIGFSQQIQGLSGNIKNNDVQITGNIDIAVTWDLVNRITSQKSLPAEKEHVENKK